VVQVPIVGIQIQNSEILTEGKRVGGVDGTMLRV